jgi:hypothetical protein
MKRTRVGVLAAAVLLLLASRSGASLIGDSVSAIFRIPATQTDLGTAIVGPGVEFTFNNCLLLDFASVSLTISARNCSILFSTPDSIFDFTDITNPFSSVNIDPVTNTPDFTASDLTISAGVISVNLGSICINGSSSESSLCPAGPNKIVLDIVSAVPEPASLVLLGWALLSFGVIRKCRKAGGR